MSYDTSRVNNCKFYFVIFYLSYLRLRLLCVMYMRKAFDVFVVTQC